MAFLDYDYYGTCNKSPGGQVTVFYEEAELTNQAFVTSATYYNQYATPPLTVWFSVNTGSFTPEVTYYASNERELTPSSGSSMMGAYINKPDDSGITGLGAYGGGDDTRCFYEGATGAGVYTPFLYGYVFTPSSETATDAVGVLTFSGAEGASAPAKATNPSPADTATGIRLNQATLTWTEGTGNDYEQVYFGESGDMSLVDNNNTSESFSLVSYLPLLYETTYQWRIDSTNDEGTTTGDVWSFTTLVFDPPGPNGGNGDSNGAFNVIKRLCACAKDKFWHEDI